MPATPLIWVPTRVLTADAATKAANAATTASRPTPRAARCARVPSPAHACQSTKPAMTKLKMAPMSKASITPRPTARPARAARSQRRGEERSASAARARKSSPKLRGCAATPQQAVEKKSEFSATARLPRKQARGENFHSRKHSQALRPRNSSVNGA